MMRSVFVLYYFKIIIAVYGNDLRVYPFNIAPPELFQGMHKSVNIGRTSLCFHFNRAVVQIFYPARYPVISCGAARRVSEPHALNIAVKYEVLPYFFQF